MDSKPLVSVVIPAFNAARTILRALESVAGQDYPNLEVIVVDDASTDGTREVIRSFPCMPVKLLSMTGNGGASAARNAGIEAASGEYVAFLDADDSWRQPKTSRQVAAAEASPSIGLVSCASVVLDGSGRVVKHLHLQNPPSEGPAAWKALLANNFIPTPTVLVRRSFLLEAGGFDPRLRIAEDLDLWIRLAAISEVAVVHEVLVDVHDQPNSLHKRHSEVEESSIMSVVEWNIERQKDRLGAAEARRIRGQRYFKLGANYYAGRMYGPSLRAFRRAAWLGFRPLKSVFNVQRAMVKLAFTAALHAGESQ